MNGRHAMTVSTMTDLAASFGSSGKHDSTGWDILLLIAATAVLIALILGFVWWPASRRRWIKTLGASTRQDPLQRVVSHPVMMKQSRRDV